MLKFDATIIYTFINILILFAFFRVFLFKPVLDILDKRKDIIENSFKEADDTKKEALELKKSYDEQLSHAHEEALEILKESRERATHEYNMQIKETKEEAARIMKEAGHTIEYERQKSVQEAQSEIATIAVLAAAKVIQQNVDENTNKRFLNDFLNEVGAAK